MGVYCTHASMQHACLHAGTRRCACLRAGVHTCFDGCAMVHACVYFCCPSVVPCRPLVVPHVAPWWFPQVKVVVVGVPRPVVVCDLFLVSESRCNIVLQQPVAVVCCDFP